mgnify:CR=1 FL=1
MLHTDLPIYRRGVDLLSLAIEVQRQMPRDFKRSIGERVHGHCVDMLNEMALANATRARERIAHIERLLTLQHTATVLLRVSFEKKIVSRALWADATEQLGSIGRQAGGWLKAARDRAPAA